MKVKDFVSRIFFWLPFFIIEFIKTTEIGMLLFNGLDHDVQITLKTWFENLAKPYPLLSPQLGAFVGNIGAQTESID